MIGLYWFTPLYLTFRLSPRQHWLYYLFQKMIRNKIDSVESVSEVSKELYVKAVTKVKQKAIKR